MLPYLRDPEYMAPAQRLSEVAQILAEGYLRLVANLSRAETLECSSPRLDFLPSQSDECTDG